MKTITIFLGGGVKLLHGENEFLKGYRNDVVDPVISQLNSREYVRQLYVVKDFTDLTRNVVATSHQEVYNAFIARDAQIAMFIIDGEMGSITKNEIDVAVDSTKKANHPLVYAYGKNIKEDDKILDYLNQEGIYFQHFFDNRDLTAKIKADVEAATVKMTRRQVYRYGMSIFLSLLLLCSAFYLIRNHMNKSVPVIDSCTAQLYLMRYHDVNALTGTNLFTDDLLARFKYDDSIMTGSDIAVFPVVGSDSATVTSPFFRLKLHNKHRNTIVFVEAKLEVDQYNAESAEMTPTYTPLHESNNNTPSVADIDELDIIRVDGKRSEYLLGGFRQNVAYGETDDRYFFCLEANDNCRFRMRIRAKSQLGDYLYSNYVYVKYVKGRENEQ